jgi:glycosyltransferase involved in cell wall biosynthesis
MISLVVPVLNEQNNILNLLTKIKIVLSENDEIIVVDDGSTDQTYDQIKNFPCKVIRHERNLGKGKSLIDGINSAKGDIIVFIDGDGQDDPSELPKLLLGIKNGYDFVIGSRFVPDDTKNNAVKKRYDSKALSPVNFIGNKALTFLLNTLFSLNIYDSQSGFKCFKSDKLRSLNLISERYEIETEMIIKSKKNKLKILEIPVYRYERENGVSNLFDIPFGRMKFMLRVLKVIIYGYIFWK